MSSISHWLLSVWSHHPATWPAWALFVYLASATICLFTVVLGKKVDMGIMTIAGIAAILTGIGAATQQDSFHFWSWLVIGLILLTKPIHQAHLRSKAKKAAKAAKK